MQAEVSTSKNQIYSRESIVFSGFSQNSYPSLVLRDTSKLSIRESMDFGQIENYQKEISVSGSILQDFNQIRHSYQRSNHLVKPRQYEDQSRFEKSHSYQIQIQKEQPSQQISLRSQSIETVIQQLRSQTSSNSQQAVVTILLILAKKEQVQSVWVVDHNDKQIKLKASKRNILKHNLALSIFSVNKSELKNYKIKYSIIKSNAFFFNKTIVASLDFSKSIVEQRAGLLCEQIASQHSDEIINSCIIYGHQYLIKYVQHLQRLDANIIKLYYKIFKQYFRAYSNKIALVYQSLSLDEGNYVYSEFFLYFIFIIYREGALQILREHNLYQKMKFNQKSLSRILSKKRFAYYDNSECLKQFIVYAIFCYSYTIFTYSSYSFINIAKTCIIQSSPLYSRAIFSKLLKTEKKEVMIKLLDNSNINNRFISNPQISLLQYLKAMLIYCSSKISILRQQKDVEQITCVLLSLLIRLNSKLQINQPSKQQEQSLSKYHTRLASLFKSKSEEFNLQIKKLGQIYFEVKGIYLKNQKIGQLFMQILSEFIFKNCPALLKYFFDLIIYPLVILPQISEQIIQLVDFFMTQQVESENIFTLMKISLDSNRIVNYQTIQFILKKYIKLNPFIHHLNCHLLRQKVEEWISSCKIHKDRKQFLYELMQVLQTKKDRMADQQSFVLCIKEIKELLSV